MFTSDTEIVGEMTFDKHQVEILLCTLERELETTLDEVCLSLIDLHIESPSHLKAKVKSLILTYLSYAISHDTLTRVSIGNRIDLLLYIHHNNLPF